MSRAQALLAGLVAIPSVNPRGAVPDGGETRVAEHVAAWARVHGWPAQLHDVEPGRANVVVRVPGDLPGTVLLQTHSDTVEVEGMTVEPFAARTVPGVTRRMTGRGVCDAKGQLAMFMAAIEQVRSSGRSHHPVVLAVCVDEEEHFRGVLDLCARLDPTGVSGAVVGEPTELRLVVAHKGVLRGRIVVRGPGGHSSRPDGVTNPVVVAAQVVQFLAEEETQRLRALEDDLVGPPALTVTMVNGGEAINIVPRTVVLQYDRRTLPDEDPTAVWARLRDDLEARWPQVSVEPPALADRGLPSSAGSDLVAALEDALVANGLEAGAVGVPYGSDASKIARLGIPCVVFGAGSIAQAHTVDEHLDLDQLDHGVRVLASLLTSSRLGDRR